MSQLSLFEPKRKTVNWHQLERPFTSQYAVPPTSEFGRVAYYDRETDRIYFSPLTLPIYFYKDKTTGKMVSGFRLPDYAIAANQARQQRYIAEAKAILCAPAPQKRTRRGTKWSKTAKGRHRRRLLHKRIEKKILGKHAKYLDYTQTLFADEYKTMIDAEYKKHLAANPDYYAGEDVNMSE